MEKVVNKNNKENQNKEKQLEAEMKNKINKEIFFNIIIAIILLAYFFLIPVIQNKFLNENIFEYLRIPATVFFLLTLIFLEMSYKKDSGKVFLRGIEFAIISAHTLSIQYIITKYNINLQLYLTISSYVFAIYYVLKSIIIYTKMRREYLKSLSDISDIVKEEEPQKKEATKKKTNTKGTNKTKKEVNNND